MLAKYSPSHHGKRIDRIILTATEHLQGCKLCREGKDKKIQREIKQVQSAVTIIYLEAAGWNSFLKYILIANYGSFRRVASVRTAPP